MVVLQLVSFVYQLPALRHDAEEFHVLQLDLMEQLDRQGGEHLILVDPKRAGLYNFRDLGAKVIWAHDLGPTANLELADYFQGRTIWELHVDGAVPQVRRWSRAAAQAAETHPTLNVAPETPGTSSRLPASSQKS